MYCCYYQYNINDKHLININSAQIKYKYNNMYPDCCTHKCRNDVFRRKESTCNIKEQKKKNVWLAIFTLSTHLQFEEHCSVLLISIRTRHFYNSRQTIWRGIQFIRECRNRSIKMSFRLFTFFYLCLTYFCNYWKILKVSPISNF